MVANLMNVDVHFLTVDGERLMAGGAAMPFNRGRQPFTVLFRKIELAIAAIEHENERRDEKNAHQQINDTVSFPARVANF